VYTYLSKKSAGCGLSEGCCFLKTHEVSGLAPSVWDPYACSAYVRVPQGAFPPTAGAGAGAGAGADTAKRVGKKASSPQQKKNVLYIVVDDLRPDLQAYGKPPPPPL
jgi:hypothetical protein